MLANRTDFLTCCQALKKNLAVFVYFGKDLSFRLLDGYNSKICAFKKSLTSTYLGYYKHDVDGMCVCVFILDNSKRHFHFDLITYLD